MKKLIALVLLLATVCFCFTSCSKDLIESLQSHKDTFIEDNKYYPQPLQEITLEVYLICDEISELAEPTVKNQINLYTHEKFKTKLNIHYVNAADYDATVRQKIGSANLILINSKELMNDLVTAGKLADLSSFYATDTYGSLNVTIAESLIDAATDKNGACYCVPNNHVITPYTYVKINIEKVHKEFHYALSDLRAMTTQEQINTLKTKLSDDGLDKDKVDNYVVVYQGDYEDRVTEADGWVCNILQYPTVDADEVYKSAFAVVNHPGVDTERVFEIIYAINTDETLRNLLQYGVKGTNYSVVDVKKTVGEEEVTDYSYIVRDQENYKYHMDLLYTGDIFHAYYCDELGYMPDVAANGKLQNQESVIAD